MLFQYSTIRTNLSSSFLPAPFHGSCRTCWVSSCPLPPTQNRSWPLCICSLVLLVISWSWNCWKMQKQAIVIIQLKPRTESSCTSINPDKNTYCFKKIHAIFHHHWNTHFTGETMLCPFLRLQQQQNHGYQWRWAINIQSFICNQYYILCENYCV